MYYVYIENQGQLGPFCRLVAHNVAIQAAKDGHNLKTNYEDGKILTEFFDGYWFCHCEKCASAHKMHKYSWGGYGPVVPDFDNDDWDVDFVYEGTYNG